LIHCQTIAQLAAVLDFQDRIAQYQKAYQTVDSPEDPSRSEADVAYIKTINCGQRCIANRVEGTLPPYYHHYHHHSLCYSSTTFIPAFCFSKVQRFMQMKTTVIVEICKTGFALC
jgi:DNA/RNA endonuclease G (NUC1)